LRIGVFGDSYAGWRALWPKYLQDHGHECTSYGEPGSSIWYSVRLLQKHAQDHDFLIWCVTTPGRLSLEVKSWMPPHNKVHWKWNEPMTTQHKDIQRLQEIFRDYYLNLVDIEEDNLLYGSLVYQLMTMYPNLMVIPCFPPPLKMSFNLWDLCCYEIRPCFDDESQWRNWWKLYKDIRPGHLTLENHARLAQEIQDNLKPGIFQTTYDKFVQVSDLDGLLELKK
jgi:hypothetical protein